MVSKIKFTIFLILLCCVTTQMQADNSALDISSFYYLRSHQYSLKPFKKVIQFSPPRTGSTLIFNILKFLFEDKKYLSSDSFGLQQPLSNKVIKTHDLGGSVSKKTLIFLTIRHPVSSIISIFRVVDKPPTESNIRDYMSRYFNTLDDVERLIKTKHTVVVLKYEEFSEDMNRIFNAIENRLRLKIDESDKSLIQKYLSKENVQNYTQQFSSFDEYDSTQFHGNHVNGGSDHYSVDEKIIRKTLSRLLPNYRSKLEKWGYDLTPK